LILEKNDFEIKINKFKMEIWKRISGFDEYSVSNHGNIASHKKQIKNNYGKWVIDYDYYKLLKLQVHKPDSDYSCYRVALYVNNISKHIRVHRLVAMMFLSDFSDDKFVDHIDGNPLNNHVSNLRMCNQRENMLNSKNNNELGFKGVSYHVNMKLWASYVYTDKNAREVKYFKYLYDAIIWRQEMVKQHYDHDYYIEDREAGTT